jgi:stage II sporulation protein D
VRRTVLVVVSVLASACAGRHTPVPAPAPPATAPAADTTRPPAAGASIRVRYVERGVTVVRDVPIEEYVRGTIISEFAPAAGQPDAVERMLEVQAVVARTYAASNRGRHRREGFDLCATTHCQIFDPGRLATSRWAASAKIAAANTAGVILTFDGRPAQAIFHADCGGHTSGAADVWGGAAPAYLVAHADDDLAGGAHMEWTFRASADAAAIALNNDPRTRVAGPIVSIDVVERDAAGRAARVAIRGRDTPDRPAGSKNESLVRGDVVRQILSAAFGARAIRSTLFDIRRDGAWLVFSGRGFGHGVGLCQAGAFARITAGTRPADVLQFYYPGTSLVSERPRS